MKMCRVFCYLFHWRRQMLESDTRWYGWRCDICGERWKAPRATFAEHAAEKDWQ